MILSCKTRISKSVTAFVTDLIGYNDAYTMITGKDAETGKPRSRWIGAAWTAVNFMPVSKVAKLAKAAKMLATARKTEKVVKDGKRIRKASAAAKLAIKRAAEKKAKRKAEKAADKYANKAAKKLDKAARKNEKALNKAKKAESTAAKRARKTESKAAKKAKKVKSRATKKAKKVESKTAKRAKKAKAKEENRATATNAVSAAKPKHETVKETQKIKSTRAKGKTGTVWDDIKSTQPNNAHSMIPKSFEMKAGGKKFWVNPNATEHMAEYATRHQGKSKKITESQKITEQQLLTSLHEATKEAVKRGYTYEEEIKVDHWSLVFSAPREAGKLPTIKHALYKP